MDTNSSPYHDILALFCLGPNGDLLSVEGIATDQISRFWLQIRDLTASVPQTCSTLPSGIQITTRTIDTSTCDDIRLCASPTCHSHVVRELNQPNKSHSIGLIRCACLHDNEFKNEFRDWIESFILLETSLQPDVDSSDQQDDKVLQTTEHITSLFEAILRNISSKDEWGIGRSFFKRRVAGFVARNDRIQMSLPAFPCKSPNPNKVGGVDPDMAERIALQTLQRFTKQVKAIYQPGVTVWIVSDGHVFSDCIGIDDELVDSYDGKLSGMYRSMFDSAEDCQAIRFRGLTDMFFSNPDALRTFDQDWARNLHIEHPISSKHTSKAESARQIMMAGFQNPREHFRKLIAEQDLPTLSLYRGQARFMQEDLYNPTFLSMSTKQRKKISFIVATEMIARNQAYSNLLELLLPNHIRLSIHAHSNRGPKFGIRLFPKDRVHPIDSVIDRHTLSPSYEFQVPTPWHNAIIKIKGDEKTYLGKAEVARKAVEGGDFEGGWVENSIEGSHFLLRPTLAAYDSPSTVTESSSFVSVDYMEESKQGQVKSEVLEVLATGSSPERTKASLAIRLRGRLYHVSHLSRSFIRSLFKKQSEVKIANHGTTVASS